MKFKPSDIPKNFSKNVYARAKKQNWKSVVDTIASRLMWGTKSPVAPYPTKLEKCNKEVRMQGPYKSVKCIQKFVLDWRISNLEFLMSYCHESDAKWNHCNSSVPIFSELFNVGKEINIESIWGLRLKSHFKCNGSYYFSLHLYLYDIINKTKDRKTIEASFVLHVINEKDQILFSKHRQKVIFELTKDKNESSKCYHGFNDFLSFVDVKSENKQVLNNLLHIRLELYIPSKAQQTEIAYPIRFNPEIQHNYSLKKFTTENYMHQHGGGRVEVVACNHSFHVGLEYLERYPKLKALCAEDKACGNCGIVTIPCYSDEAVKSLLSFVVGDFTQNVIKMDAALLELLRISHEFDLTVLMYDTWLNVLLLLRLEHLPFVMVLARHYQAPEFVTNYVRVLFLMFLYELQQLKVYHYWIWKEPLAFVSIFMPDKKHRVTTQDALESIVHSQDYFIHEFCRLSEQETPAMMSSENSIQESVPELNDMDDVEILLIDEVLLESTVNIDAHDTACKCKLCRQTHSFCRERLLIDYLAKAELMQESYLTTLDRGR